MAHPLPLRHELSPEVIARFWSRVQKSEGDGCWEWTGVRHTTGYGFLKVKGIQYRAPRLSLMIHLGVSHLDGLVCHRCDNPPCVRPDHLYVGTDTENTRDRVRRGVHVKLGDDALFLHPCGLWAKKIFGRHRYFGSDKKTALRRFREEYGHLYAPR